MHTLFASPLASPLPKRLPVPLHQSAVSAPAAPTPHTLAMAVLRELMQIRRAAGPDTCSPLAPCAACLAPHLPRLVAAIERRQPVTFVLPAFPGKSPNPSKVLGVLPDMAERRALELLQQVCERVGRISTTGARIILASDGRVFSDVVGMRDEDVSAYRDGLREMIADLGLDRLSTFNLEDLYDGASFDEIRARMMSQFGQPIEAIRDVVRRAVHDPQASADERALHRLYCGITRFLVEDATFPGQTMSRNAIQKECRVRAYEVIQRSQAWSAVVAHHFPQAVRLSIHPHGCGAGKLGIHFIETAEGDSWMTPWHGVAVEVEAGRVVLMKRSAAEALGARLVDQGGRDARYTRVR